MNQQLRKSRVSTPWQQRLKELVLAGGVLGIVGCTADSAGKHLSDADACGNANPDPCICGKPEASAQGAKACAAKTACERSGRDWEIADDGGVVCLGDASIENHP